MKEKGCVDFVHSPFKIESERSKSLPVFGSYTDLGFIANYLDKKQYLVVCQIVWTIGRTVLQFFLAESR